MLLTDAELANLRAYEAKRWEALNLLTRFSIHVQLGYDDDDDGNEAPFGSEIALHHLLTHVDALSAALAAEQTLADDLARELHTCRPHTWRGSDVMVRYHAARTTQPAAQTTGGD